MERLRFTFTPNGRREFVPRDKVFPLFSVNSLLLLHKKISSFMPVLIIGIVRDWFYGFICLKPPLKFANASDFCLKATLENSSCVLPSSVESRIKEFHAVLIVTAKVCTKTRRDLP